MARLLAVDWDLREMRLAVADGGAGGSLRVRALRALPLVMRSVDEGEPPQADYGQTLRQLLAEEGSKRATLLLGVDRGHVEFIDLTLPPAKDSELSELVALQVMHDAPALGEDAAIDYLPLSADASQPRKVLAAAVAAEQMARFHGICAAAGVKPRRLLLRGFALVSLFNHAAKAPERGLLLVDRIGDEADLAVVYDGQATLLRTVRLPSGEQSDKAVERLLTETQRTLSVVPSEGDQPGVECIYLCGRAAEQEELAAKIAATTDLDVHIFDPFHTLGIPETALDENPERFAPLLGMLADEARGGHALDFLNPRRAAPRASRRRPLTLAAIGLGLAVLLGGYSIWEKLAVVDEENQQLEQRLRELKANAKKAGERTKLVDAVRDWLAGDVDWLDELRDLSVRFPPARDMVVLRMNFTSTPRAGGGEVTLQGVVRDPLVVARMENNIRDKYHEVSSKRVQERVRNKTYSWHFETSIAVDRRDKEHYTSHRQSTEKEKEPPTALATPVSGTASGTALSATSSSATALSATSSSATALSATLSSGTSSAAAAASSTATAAPAPGGKPAAEGRARP